MKNFKFLAAVCCMAAVFAACEKNEPSDNTNGNGVNTEQNDGTNTDQNDGNSNSGNNNATDTNGHDYVDLGLSVKWATCNVGATKPEEYGNYYAWGETEPKTTYYWNTYKWCNGSSSTFTKYNTKSSYGTVDNKTVLDPEDDAAAVNWGGAWRMPTDAEWTELRENCTWTWTTKNGVNGYEVKGTNDNSIFLPAAGYRSYDDLLNAGDVGDYWSSSLCTGDPSGAWNVGFYSEYVGRNYDDRYFGQSVRPVLE